MEHVEVLREVEARFVSGNSIPVERVHITRAEFDAIAALSAPAEAQPLPNGVVQRHVVTKFSDGSTRVEDVLTAPSAPVGVEGLLADLETIWHSVSDDKATNAAYQRLKSALAQQPAAVDEAIRSLPALWRQREDNGEERTEFDKGYEQASDECADALEAALAAQQGGSDNDQ